MTVESFHNIENNDDYFEIPIDHLFEFNKLLIRVRKNFDEAHSHSKKRYVLAGGAGFMAELTPVGGIILFMGAIKEQKTIITHLSAIREQTKQMKKSIIETDQDIEEVGPTIRVSNTTIDELQVLRDDMRNNFDISRKLGWVKTGAIFGAGITLFNYFPVAIAFTGTAMVVHEISEKHIDRAFNSFDKYKNTLWGLTDWNTMAVKYYCSKLYKTT